MALKIGKMGRASRSRLRACRTWPIGAKLGIGAVPADGRKHCCRVLVGCGDHRQCLLRVLVRE